MSNYKKLNDIGNSASTTSATVNSNISVVPEITSLEDKNALLKNNKLVVVDVYATWCGPCSDTTPLFAALYDKYKSLCILVRENVDLRLSPTVQVVPTFQIFVNGKLNSQITGNSIEEVENTILKFIK